MDERGSDAADRRETRDLDRLVFFSDAVMAIAITLLVIDLRLPDLPPITTEADLRAAILELGPRLFAFFLSFGVIGLWWSSHHRFFGSVVRVDGPLLWLDLAYLAAIAFLPFPTSILGTTLVPTSVALYALTNAVIGYLLVGLRTYADRRALLDPAVPLDLFRRRTRTAWIGPTVFAVSIPIAYVAPVAAVWSWNLVWIGILIARRVFGPVGRH
jgi:uncharacterized membrane protein